LKSSIKLIIITFLFIFINSFALTYTVKPGDNPEKIARKFGVSVKELLRANNIKNPKRLRAGQRLRIPVKTKKKTKKVVKAKKTKSSKYTSSYRRCRVIYKVKRGESLLLIAKKFRVKLSDLKRWNNLRSNKIVPGQRLCIRPIKSSSTSSKRSRRSSKSSRGKVRHKRIITYYKVRRGDSLWIIAKRFNTTISELKRLNGRKIKLRPGQRIKVPKTITYVVKEKKKKRTERARRSTQRRTTARKTTRRRTERRTRSSSRLRFIYPVQGKVIKGFVNSETERHVGIDIKTSCGAPIKAVEDGKVIYAGDSIKTFGNLIIIRHRNRYNSVYGHVGKILVREGERVRRGQIIGKTGTLNQRGCGLYFEIRKNTIPINPLSVLERE